MNEYSDQVTWFEVQRRTGRRTWATVSDYNTFEGAEGGRRTLAAIRPDDEFRTRRVSGQGA